MRSEEKGREEKRSEEKRGEKRREEMREMREERDGSSAICMH